MAIDPSILPAEPPILAEQGVTTSEWKLALAFLAQVLAAGTAAVLAHTNFNVDAATLSTIVTLEIVGGGVVASYVISRGIRKFGAK